MENKILGFTLSLALLGAAASVQAQTYTTLDNPAGTGGTYCLWHFRQQHRGVVCQQLWLATWFSLQWQHLYDVD